MEPPVKRLTLSLALALGLLAALPSLADTLLIQRAQVASKADLPKRGTSMAQVEARFGAPEQKFAPVGGGSVHTPPITRWQYASFSHVVDAVLTKASPLEIGPAPAKP